MLCDDFDVVVVVVRAKSERVCGMFLFLFLFFMCGVSSCLEATRSMGLLTVTAKE